MCLYPKRYINKKYTATEKNGGVIPTLPVIGHDSQGEPVYDYRVLHIEIPCGQCIECRNAKAREWQVRLAEEIKAHKYNYFITLTFAPKELEQLCLKSRLGECNAVCGYAVRHMLERWRKDNKKSIKHWLITELGHEGTERIHMHGLLFNDKPIEFGEVDDNHLRKWKYWKYGHIYVGEYVNNRTINYISKYITKIDNDHKGFIGQILASAGIGKQFLEKTKYSNEYKYRPRANSDYYRLENGCKVKLPTYYKNKLYNENEREQIWREFMDSEKLSVMGKEHELRTTPGKTIERIIENAQNNNIFQGYGNDRKEWRKKPYNITKRMLQQQARLEAMNKMRKALGMPTLGAK